MQCGGDAFQSNNGGTGAAAGTGGSADGSAGSGAAAGAGGSAGSAGSGMAGGSGVGGVAGSGGGVAGEAGVGGAPGGGPGVGGAPGGGPGVGGGPGGGPGVGGGPTDAGPPPCFDSTACSSTHYCDFEDDSCGGAGICTPKPSGCDAVVDPVCGCDGNIYTSACNAMQLGMDVAPYEHCGLCPPVSPLAGSSCTVAGIECTYGDGVRPECRSTAMCDATGSWIITSPACSLPGSCSAVSASPGSPCLMHGDECVETAAGAACICTDCFNGPCAPPPKWDCFTAPGDPCPKYAPNRGQPCFNLAQSCSYGSCSGLAITVSCTQGIWEWSTRTCPQ